MAASAQYQDPPRNPDPNTPVAIPPDALAQPQPAVQPPPAENWDHPWRFEKVTDDDDWTRHFRLGALVGMNISANFNVKNPITFSGKGAAQGNYDDGYLHPSADGQHTTDWGYNDPGQYSAAQQTLTMHQATSFAANGGTSSESGDTAFVGFDMAYGGNLWHWGSAKIGWDLGFGLLPISIKDKLSLTGDVKQNFYSFDTSDFQNSHVNFPTAPHQGGPDGTGGLPSTPVSTGTDTVPDQSLTGTRTLDVTLYTVRLGPSMYWDLNEHFGLSAGVGPAVGIVSGNLHYDETINTTRYKGQVDATDMVYGGYVNASLMYHLVENGDLYLGVQYMSLGNANISGGGRSAELDLHGQVYISAGINWPF